MSHDWKDTVRELLKHVEHDENPFARVDAVSREIAQDANKVTRSISDLETALKGKGLLSFITRTEHPEEMVRDYLSDVLAALRKVAPAQPAAPTQTYKPPKNLLVAVDFDGTIVEHRFPEIGPPLPGAIETLLALQKAGHRLILFTCREDGMDSSGRKYLAEALDFCRERGVNFVSANETMGEDDFRPQGGRKVYADVYIDDRNLGGFPGWKKIKELLLGIHT